jgi:pyruvate kinase
MIREKHMMKSLLDGSDCVMLLSETANPVQCIKTMSALTQEAEACLWNERFSEEQLKQVSLNRALCVQMDFTGTFQANAKCNSINCV